MNTYRISVISTLALLFGLAAAACKDKGEEVSLGNDDTGGTAGSSEAGGSSSKAGNGNEAGESGQAAGGDSSQGGAGNGGARPAGGSPNSGGNQGRGGDPASGGKGGTTPTAGSGPSPQGGANPSGGAAGAPIQTGGGTETGGAAPSEGGAAEGGAAEEGGTVSSQGGQQQEGGAPTAGTGQGGEAGSGVAGSAGSGSSICELPMESGDCPGAMSRYYFNTAIQSCEEFTYGGCDGNANNFETLEECEAACPGDPCKAPPQSSGCDLTIMSYYFDEGTGTCMAYGPGTCGIAPNSFRSVSECESTCSPVNQCVVAVEQELPCCKDAVAMFTSELAAAEDLILYPFFGYPEECSIVDCWRAPPSRVAAATDPTSCGFTDECQSADDCMMLIDSTQCCPCPQAFPKSLPKIDPCWIVPGDPVPEECRRPCPEPYCDECPGHVLSCEDGYPEPYKQCKGV